MANILYFNLTNVKEAKGGRPQTIMFTGNDVKPNGSIVTLGATMEQANGTNRELDHVHAVTFGALDSVIGKWVIAAPEIVEEQYRMISDKAWKFALQPNETYAAYQLQALDRLEYSEAHFDGAITGYKVGDHVKINAQGKFVKGSGASDSAFRIVTILDVNKPVVLEANKKDVAFIPQLGKMVKLEVVR